MDELNNIAENGYMTFLKAAKEAYKNYYSDDSVTPGMACLYFIALKGIQEKELIGNKYLGQFLNASPEKLAKILWAYLIDKGYRYHKVSTELLVKGSGYHEEPTPIIQEFARDHLIPLLQSRAKEMYLENSPSVDALNVWGVSYPQSCWVLLNLIDPSKNVLQLKTVYRQGSPVYLIYLDRANLKQMPKKKPVTESAAITKKINATLPFFRHPISLYKEYCTTPDTLLYRYLNYVYDIPKLGVDGTGTWNAGEFLSMSPKDFNRAQKRLTALANRRKKILTMMPDNYLDIYLAILNAMSSNVMELITKKPGSSLHDIAELLLEGVSPERIAKLAYSRYSKTLKPIQP